MHRKIVTLYTMFLKQMYRYSAFVYHNVQGHVEIMFNYSNYTDC